MPFVPPSKVIPPKKNRRVIAPIKVMFCPDKKVVDCKHEFLDKNEQIGVLKPN